MQADASTPREWWPKELVKDQQDEIGRRMVACARNIETSVYETQSADMDLVRARMFENSPLASLYHFGGPATRAAPVMFDIGNRATWNVLRSVIMTAASQITRNRTRARFQTTNGNWKQKRKAKKLTQFCDGLASETKMYELTRRTFIDCMVFRAGGIQVIKDTAKKRIRFQRVLAHEVLVDANDGINGEPRTMYRRRYMNRDTVLAKFGGKDVNAPKYIAIKKAQAIDPLGVGGETNMIPVYEAWHLPALDDKSDGRHCIAVEGEGGLLFVEPWDKDYFPIVWCRWEDALSGYWGRSLAEQLEQAQFELDKHLARIERGHRLFSIPRLGVPRGSKVVKSAITNQEGSMVEFTGPQPPVPLVWPSFTGDIYKWVENLVQKMYDLAGVSRNAAQGQKETGVTSGEAIRESIDVQQARMATTEQRWEAYHIEIFKMAVDFARDIYAEKGSFTVKVPGEKFLETIDWAEVNLDEDEYILDAYPTSYLPITPQGRLSTIKDLMEAGIWTPRRAQAALDDLDVDREMSMDQAAEHYLEQQMETMLYDGKAQHPDDFTPQQLAVEKGAQYVNMGRSDNAPEKNIDLVQRYLDELMDIQERKMPPPAPPGAQGAPPAPGPQAAPSPAPPGVGGPSLMPMAV